MKTEPAGYIWCSMCGFNRWLNDEQFADAQLRDYENDQHECPDCASLEQFSFLQSGEELDYDVTPDELMEQFNGEI